MPTLARLVSLVALGAMILPCLLYFFGAVGLDLVKGSALAGTFGWFAATPLWMGREPRDGVKDVEV